jgi:nucleolar protein 15
VYRRIPHGFYEHQLKAYFSQFGNITRLRLARNRKSGAPKHYAFLEFDSTVVAEIVQKTMDKYLMFGHLLQVRLVPPEQVHERLFKGANSRFKKIPWGKMEARGLKVGRERDLWQRRIDREQARREKRKADMGALDYDFDLPALKKVQVVKTRAERHIGDVVDKPEEEEVKAIEQAVQEVVIVGGDEAKSTDHPTIDGTAQEAPKSKKKPAKSEKTKKPAKSEKTKQKAKKGKKASAQA